MVQTLAAEAQKARRTVDLDAAALQICVSPFDTGQPAVRSGMLYAPHAGLAELNGMLIQTATRSRYISVACSGRNLDISAVSSCKRSCNPRALLLEGASFHEEAEFIDRMLLKRLGTARVRHLLARREILPWGVAWSRR